MGTKLEKQIHGADHEQDLRAGTENVLLAVGLGKACELVSEDLAAEMDGAVYGITHFTKGTAGRNPVERVTGSLAFGALTRIVTVAVKMPEEGDHPKGARLFARAKSNIGPDGGGFYYFLEVGEVPGHPGLSNIHVLWGEPVDGTARQLLAKAESIETDQGATGEAAAWLRKMLVDGSLSASEVLTQAKKMGFKPKNSTR